MYDIIRCPYRKMATEYIRDGLREMEETFPQCQGDECPFYVPDKKTGKHICGRVRKELAVLVRLDKEEERLSIWAN